MLQQMDFCVKYFPRVAIETCQHLSAEVIPCRPVCCCARYRMACRLNHLQPLQRLIKEPGGPGRLRPLSYCHQGWASNVVRAGLEGGGWAGGPRRAPRRARQLQARGEERKTARAHPGPTVCCWWSRGLSISVTTLEGGSCCSHFFR